MPQPNFLEPTDTFVPRHIGPTDSDIQEMLATLSLPSLDSLVEATVPSDIRLQTSLTVPSPRGEQQVLAELRDMAGQNQVWRSLIGMGYYDCVTPLVIQRNILEDPGWYTQYTPYQAEIAQGRLEALVNFQTMVADLTGLPLANASLLDEATAAAEAMTMCAAMSRAAGHERKKFFVSENCHPQTIAVVQTRAEPLGIVLQIGAIQSLDLSGTSSSGCCSNIPRRTGTSVITASSSRARMPRGPTSWWRPTY
jgi:glycine dehydrogenase